MLEFRYSEDREKGTYKPCYGEDGRKTANIICPNCATLLHLHPHKVTSQGVVKPSVVCHNCEFHDYITLKDWKE